MGRMTTEGKTIAGWMGWGHIVPFCSKNNNKKKSGFLFVCCLWLYLLVSVQAKFRASPLISSLFHFVTAGAMWTRLVCR